LRFDKRSALRISTISLTTDYAYFAAVRHADREVAAKQDRMINPDLDRIVTGRAKSETSELPGSHATFP
jgi:hypothetical protein